MLLKQETEVFMKKILITGSSGFIGRALTENVCSGKGLDVYAVISGRRSVLFPANINVITADLLSSSSVDSIINKVRPEIIVHLAWGLEGKDFLESEKNKDWLKSSFRLLSKFIENDGQRFIFVGSSAEYGYGKKTYIETDNSVPENLYGECKLAFTETAKKYCKDTGLEFVSTRVFSVYGPNEIQNLHAIPSAISNFINGNPFVCKGPNNVWDYVYIDDVAYALTKLITSPFCGIVNIASGKPSIMRDVFEEIARQLDCPHLLSFENEESVGRMLVADTTILNDICGIVCGTSLQEGIGKTLEWWKTRQVQLNKKALRG
jgi:nucleoside-diphosphate-sugar epimerase